MPHSEYGVNTLLIIASSGRMLAQAAKNAGLQSLVIDLFADLDTQAYATDFRQVKSLSKPDLVPAVEYFIERYAVADVIYGSGFENHLDSLYYLDRRLTLLGNSPDVFAIQLNKQQFFSTLTELNIPFPEVVFTPPECVYGWLVKPMQGQGGIGIKHYLATDDDKDLFYWQKFQTGVPRSVLFLADSQDLQVIGFNRQWSVCLSESQSFVFSGVINRTELPDWHKAEITAWLKQMVPVFGLKGLNSLDFISAENCSYVLEINPRPSASMQLYDDNLLVRHIQSFVGTIVGATSVALSQEIGRLKSPPQIGYQIVYADRDLQIPEQFIWPDWCMDLPKSGNICHTALPICSIIAHQNELQSVEEQLLTRQQLITNQLQRF
jgi:methenyltetrahydromethanopterin cyclohydrolase